LLRLRVQFPLPASALVRFHAVSAVFSRIIAAKKEFVIFKF
jgi:hypothetical protein